MVMNSVPGLKYADVLLPLRLGGEVTYIVPQETGFENCREGSRVWVEFSSRRYCGVVTAVYTHPPHHDKEVAYKNLLSVGQGFVRPWELRFWKNMADYYLCTAGEVYRAACPSALIRQQEVKSRKSPEQFFEAVRKEEPAGPRVPELSAAQHEAFEKAVQLLETGKKPVLLHGVAGSGKTEIYISLALEELKKGKTVADTREIEKKAYITVYEKSENDELAGYISDDFGLIADSKRLGYSDKWLEKLISCYENARIPCGEL